jgi:hypothetical protein
MSAKGRPSMSSRFPEPRRMHRSVRPGWTLRHLCRKSRRSRPQRPARRQAPRTPHRCLSPHCLRRNCWLSHRAWSGRMAWRERKMAWPGAPWDSGARHARRLAPRSWRDGLPVLEVNASMRRSHSFDADFRIPKVPPLPLRVVRSFAEEDGVSCPLLGGGFVALLAVR